MFQVIDHLTLDAPKRTTDGFMAVRARSARTGIYDYAGREFPDRPAQFGDNDRLKIYRDQADVFAEDSVRSFLAKPITDNHPTTYVDARNWRENARGTIMGAMRDGEHLAFDLVLMDQSAIDAVDQGKRELSAGYACDIEWAPGKTADGEHYDGRMINIRGNHVALVDRGRAGPSCAIADGTRFAVCDANPAASRGINTKENGPVKKITIDGLQVDLADAEAVGVAIDKLKANATRAFEAKDKAEADVAKLTTDLASATAEVETLKQKLADASITPQMLRDAAKDYADTAAKAKAIGAKVSDDMGVADMKRAAVSVKLGDKAADWTDEQVAISFDTLAADMKPDQKKPAEHIGQPQVTDSDADDATAAAYEAMVTDMKTPKRFGAAAN